MRTQQANGRSGGKKDKNEIEKATKTRKEPEKLHHLIVYDVSDADLNE